jgi:hypothetical protein
MAATIPDPINNTPTATGSWNPNGVPPVSGNAVVVAAPGLLLALAVAACVALDVGVALAVDEAVAVGLAATSSPVGLSSKPRTSP